MTTTMTDFHMSRSDRLFLMGTGLMTVCAEALFFVLVAWAIGGSEFKDSFYGDTAMVVLGVGFIVGAVFDLLAKNPGHGA